MKRDDDDANILAVHETIKKVTAEAVEDFLFHQTEIYWDVCDSPIEVMFLIGLNLVCGSDRWAHSGLMIHHKREKPVAQAVAQVLLDPGCHLYVFPQMKVESYRVDFGIMLKGIEGTVCGLVVECDGHAYHYGDKKKVSADRLRDRDLQAMGLRVLRFPGRDLYANLRPCAEEIKNWADNVRVCDQLDNKVDSTCIGEVRSNGLFALGRRVKVEPEDPVPTADDCGEIPF